MAETTPTEEVSIKSLEDGDKILLDDGSVFELGDYLTWEPDGAHLEGTVDGQVRAIVLDKDANVKRLLER